MWVCACTYVGHRSEEGSLVASRMCARGGKEEGKEEREGKGREGKEKKGGEGNKSLLSLPPRLRTMLET